MVKALKLLATLAEHGHQPDCDILKPRVMTEPNDHGVLTEYAIIRNCDCQVGVY